MRTALLTLANCGLTLATVAAIAVGAHAHHVQDVHAQELEHQNAALLKGYDDLRGGYVECLQKNVDELAAAADGGLARWQQFQERAAARGELIDP